MTGTPTVLLVGGTGRTGRRVLERLLNRGVAVRAIVRSASRLSDSVRARPGVSVVVASLLDLSDDDLRAHLHGCDVVVSCLGHTTNLRGIFGPPQDLVTRAARRLCEAIRASRPDRPIRFVLMSSVSVNHPDVVEARRSGFERLVLSALRALVPPAQDNQRAAEYLCREVGIDDPYVRWVVVRPDTLLEGASSPYALHDAITSSLFRPDSTNRANVASFMCDLATDPESWSAWVGKFPVIVNAESVGSASGP